MAEIAKPVAPAFKSLQKSPQRECIIVHAKPKEGKTTLALSASAQFDINNPKPGVISDIGIITFDATGLTYARALGYEVAYWTDMSEHMARGVAVFDKMLELALAGYAQLANEGKIHTLIIDPISVLDIYWRGELAKSYEGWPLAEQMNLKHERFLLQQLLPLACNTVLLFHNKQLSATMTNEKKAQYGLDPEDTVVIDMGSYDAPKLYRSQASLILPLYCTRGKTIKDDQYNLYPRGHRGMEAGSRYDQINACDKLPADMKEVFKLIKSANKAV
jgi:hypothetical protein